MPFLTAREAKLDLLVRKPKERNAVILDSVGQVRHLVSLLTHGDQPTYPLLYIAYNTPYTPIGAKN